MLYVSSLVELLSWRRLVLYLLDSRRFSSFPGDLRLLPGDLRGWNARGYIDIEACVLLYVLASYPGKIYNGRNYILLLRYYIYLVRKPNLKMSLGTPLDLRKHLKIRIWVLFLIRSQATTV